MERGQNAVPRPRAEGRLGIATSDALQRLVDALPDLAVLLLDREGHILTWNSGAAVIKGYAEAEVIGKHISLFYTPEAVSVGHPDRELELAALTGRYDEQGWRVRRDGSRFWARVQILAIRDDDGDLAGFGKVTQDLTHTREKEEQLANVLGLLEQTIRLDHLTGLPNRRAWDERFEREIGESALRHRPLCIGLLDLDHFKQFNDQHGHQAGDTLLKRASLRWRQNLRPADMLARYGGEEFILALPACGLTEAESVLRRLIAATPDGQTVSAGLALWDYHESRDQLLSRVDQALYRAKGNGRNQVQVSAPAP